MVQMWQEILEQPVVLEGIIGNLEAVKEAVRMIGAQDIATVCIAARGTSDHAAVYGKYLIELITGIPVSLAASSILTIYQKDLHYKNSLVIGISQSGEAADCLEIIRSANRQGALTLSITNAPDSPLAREAKIHLYCGAGIEQSVAATKTFTAQIFLLAQLVAEWGKVTELIGELAQVPEQIARTLELHRDIAGKVERYRLMNECFVLARGINYAIALETALKIQETNYVRAKAYAASDFQHGPIAMVERDIPAIILAPEGPSFQDMAGMINMLQNSREELIIVSNNKELLKAGACGLAIPDTGNDIISPFFNAAVAQMFACQLALVKGLNPDQPRGLNKITITR